MVTTAFVLSGGVSLGAVQVGMLQALTEHGIIPDLLVGTSAGALNAAFISGHGADPAGVESLRRVWADLNVRTLFALDPVRALRALAGRSSSIGSDRGLRRLIDRHLAFELLEEAPIPLQVVTTELVTGREVVLRTGDARQAVLASSALPGLLPAVMHDGLALVDGGLADNTAISQAVLAGAETIYVLPSGYACALVELPRTPLEAVTRALAILTHQRVVADVARYSPKNDLIVLPPPCPIAISPINFGRSEDLVHRAHSAATEALRRDGGRRAHPARTIALHSHQPASHR